MADAVGYWMTVARQALRSSRDALFGHWIRAALALVVTAAALLILPLLFGDGGMEQLESEMRWFVSVAVACVIVFFVVFLLQLLVVPPQLHLNQQRAFESACAERDNALEARDAAIRQLNAPPLNPHLELARRYLRGYASDLRSFKLPKAPNANVEAVDRQVRRFEDPLRRLLTDSSGFRSAGEEFFNRRGETRNEWLEAKARWLEERADALRLEDVHPQFLLSQGRLDR